MAGKSKYDADVVRGAARGRWVQILEQIGGIPAELLDDSKEHPCPKCNGNTRFRLVDKEAGAVLCSHCFSSKNGDGFAAIMWATDCDFPAALEKVATYCGVQPRAASKVIDPAKDLEFVTWNSDLVKLFLNKKKGVTEEAMLAAGAKRAKYKGKYVVYAFPIIGETLDIDKPVGWALIDFQGNDLPVWNQTGEVVRMTKVKLTSGSKPGFFGVHGIERLKTEGLVEKIWKVEGLTDLLSLWSNQPEAVRDKEIVLSSSCGAGELPRWQPSVMAGVDVNVVHDADTPGQDGAKNWVQAIAIQQPEGKTVCNVQLPYTVEPSKGKDLRDFFNEKNTYNDLIHLAEKADRVTIAKNKSGNIADYSQIEYPIHEKIMRLLSIEVMEEFEDGSISIYSTFLGKESTIKNIGRVKREDMLLYCGTPGQIHISDKADTENDVYTITDVREAIALTASKRRGKKDRCGVGIWQGIDEAGNETKTLVFANDASAARRNGDKILRPVVAPRVDGLMLNFGKSQDWFDFDTLQSNLKNAEDQKWRTSVVEKCEELFSRWRWKNEVNDPTIITGLILASWVQTIWDWRPLVSITGESHSGKSYFFEALGGDEHHAGIFGNLSARCSNLTEAAARITIANTGMIAFFDEFEDSKHRASILKNVLRPATRGDTISRATSGQKKNDFRVRHIIWTAAIESGLKEQADVNRFIKFELLKPESDNEGKLELPDGRELSDLGQKTLAVAAWCAMEAKALAKRLKTTKVAGIDARTIECFSAPASILAVAHGFTDDQAKSFLKTLVESIELHEQGNTDHQELLDCILSSQVSCGHPDGMLSVGQILQPPRMVSSRFSAHKSKLEAVGIRITKTDDLFVYHRQVVRTILRQTAWEGKRIDQLLKRLPGAKTDAQRIAGRTVRGITIPGHLMCLDSEDSQEELDFPADGYSTNGHPNSL